MHKDVRVFVHATMMVTAITQKYFELSELLSGRSVRNWQENTVQQVWERFDAFNFFRNPLLPARTVQWLKRKVRQGVQGCVLMRPGVGGLVAFN